MSDKYAPYEAVLKRLGWERTRENFLAVLYNGEVPEDLDEEDERALPPDLRRQRP